MIGTTGTALDHVLAFLLPFFLRGANGDQALARQAAIEMLDAHGAGNDRQLLLAAEVIAFSFTVLDNLGQSVADPDLSMTTRLRLRSNANALSRAAERNRQNLRRAQKAASPKPVKPAAPPAMIQPVALQKVRDGIIEAAPIPAEDLANAAQTLSRQQRRFLARKAEQARAAQDRAARKAARLAPRAAATA